MIQKNKPNVVIILVDELRTQNMSLFGYKEENDKNIKRIAKESLFFKNIISCCNSTDPSITSLFTAKYPVNNGIIHQFPHTKDSEIKKFKNQKQFWFPSYLKAKGYNTIAIDWLPMWFKEGFNFSRDREEHLISKIINSNRLINTIVLNLPDFIYKIGKKRLDKKMACFPDPDETANLAIKKIKQTKKPFFLFVHFGDTHFPYKTTKQPEDKGKTYLPNIIEKIKGKTRKNVAEKRITDIGLHYLEAIEKKYNRAIRNVDKEIGRIYNFLKKEKIIDNTIFVFLSDHGTNLGEHNIFFDHQGLYDETIRVPLIIRFPKQKQSKVVNKLAQNIDIIPTILQYLKEEKHFNLDGKSLFPAIQNNKTIRNHTLSYAATCDKRIAKRTLKKKVIFSKTRKDAVCYKNKEPLIQGKGLIETYDLIKDPKEKKNLKQRINKRRQCTALPKYN